MALCIIMIIIIKNFLGTYYVQDILQLPSIDYFI